MPPGIMKGWMAPAIRLTTGGYATRGGPARIANSLSRHAAVSSTRSPSGVSAPDVP